MNETNNEDNMISMVYANDTVDFGMIDLGTTSMTRDGVSSCKQNDATQSASDSYSDSYSDDNSDNESTKHDRNNAHRRRLPQHCADPNSNNNNRLLTNIIDCMDPYDQYLTAPADPTIIDNRRLVYVPVKLACGISAYCSPDVLKHCPMVLRSIQADISRALSVLPVSVHSLVRRTKLWLNYNGYLYGPVANPQILRHVTTHHHPAWLVECACDSPQKAIGIEIYSCVDYDTMRLHWNGSGLLLHELCHVIHQCCLEDGLVNRTVEALYETADMSGNYETVLRRDWAGKTKTTSTKTTMTTAECSDSDLAYAMVDPKEFFAELSVAYFCDSYRSLDNADPTVMEACSPPLLHPVATERIRLLVMQRNRARVAAAAAAKEIHSNEGNNNTLEINYTEHRYDVIDEGNRYQQLIGIDGDNNPSNAIWKDCHNNVDGTNECFWGPFQKRLTLVLKNLAHKQPLLSGIINDDESYYYEDDPQLSLWLKLTNPNFRDNAMSNNCATIRHCNKFYPFTKGQLKHHDRELFDKMRNLWREIALWEDPFASVRTKRKMARSCSRRCPKLLF